MNPISTLIEQLGLTHAWTYTALFLTASFFMIWRLDAMGRAGLEGTALGTVVMPFCSGLGNLFFVWIVYSRNLPAGEIATNAIVNNVTNLTLLTGMPAMLFGLSLLPRAKGRRRGGKKGGRGRSADASVATAGKLNRLSLLLTLVGGLFFTGASWVLARDGRLDQGDGAMLVGLFVFWLCVQGFDVMKYNVHRNRSLHPTIYLDGLLVLIAAAVLYTSIEWLVTWFEQVLLAKDGAPGMLGWVSGLLMAVPNGLIAFYYAAQGKGDIVYASQIGDGHICIPLCLGLAALLTPVAIPAHFNLGLALIGAALMVHLLVILWLRELPRIGGWILAAAYCGFLVVGFSD